VTPRPRRSEPVEDVETLDNFVRVAQTLLPDIWKVSGPVKQNRDTTATDADVSDAIEYLKNRVDGKTKQEIAYMLKNGDLVLPMGAHSAAVASMFKEVDGILKFVS
jgi:hypothetical protein